MTPRTSRAYLPGLVLGLVALAVLVASSVVLERSGGGEDSIELPDSLPGGWQAVTEPRTTEGGDEAAAQEYADTQRQAVDYVEEQLDEVYDEPTAFQAYTTEEGDRFVTVTAFSAEGGAYAPPNGVADAAQVGLARAPVELVREGDAVCSVQWPQVPAGQDIDESAPPVSTTCQLGDDGRTYMLSASEMEVEETVELLEAVAQEQ